MKIDESNWQGFELGYPDMVSGLNVREGDFVLMNPHVYHCNTDFTSTTEPYTRLSFVFYARSGLL